MSQRTAFYRMAVMAGNGTHYGVASKLRASRMSRRQYIFAIENLLWDGLQDTSFDLDAQVIGWLLLDLLWKEATP